jgi:hypothetical protein
MADDHRVIVGIDHPRHRHATLHDLVHAAGRRQPGSDVQELADPGLVGQESSGGCGERLCRTRVPVTG